MITLIHGAFKHNPVIHIYGHSTIEYAIGMALEARVKKFVLVHYYLEQPYINKRGEHTKIKDPHVIRDSMEV